MAQSIDSLIERWDGFGVVTRFDKPTGAWMFIALHNDTLGMPSGGTRMKVYPTPSDGLRDAMRLAEGMTYKWAGVDFDFGGGKAVIALSQSVAGGERTALLRRYGQLLESLHGAFGTGVDMGTTPEDMLLIASETKYVHGVDVDTRTSPDPGPYTARGVLAGIKAAVGQLFGSADVNGRVVHVQGVGDVGEPLVHMLHEAGASLLLSDLDSKRATALAAAAGGARVLDPETGIFEQCDVFAPCAVGAILNDTTIPKLDCRVIAGSANNQLESKQHADALMQRGILYVPDYIVNAGGAIALAMIGRGQTDTVLINARVDGIQSSLTEILGEARKRSETPVAAARRVVDRRLASAGSTLT